MKFMYCIKYVFQHILVIVLIILGDAPILNDRFYNRTYDYFTKFGDRRRVFELYLNNNGIEEKPYFLKNGFDLKSQFKMSVVNLSDEERTKTYPLKRK